MNLDSILGHRSVRVDFWARDKEEALSEMSSFSGGILGLDPDRVLSSLRSREALGSTALGSGIMIPHGKLDGVEGIHLFLMRTVSDFGLDFGSPDGLPVRMIALIITPLDPVPCYLRLLTLVGRMWDSPNNVTAMLACPDETTLRQTFLLLSGSSGAT
jgi:PTS system nitrogen regulatory IIA component